MPFFSLLVSTSKGRLAMCLWSGHNGQSSECSFRWWHGPSKWVSRQLLSHKVSQGWQLGTEAVSMSLLGMPHSIPQCSVYKMRKKWHSDFPCGSGIRDSQAFCSINQALFTWKGAKRARAKKVCLESQAVMSSMQSCSSKPLAPLDALYRTAEANPS